MAGIYIHIPFCKQACTYCDFHFSTLIKHKEEFIAALKNEIVLRKKYLDNGSFNTIYLGGGTPSLLSKTELHSIIDLIYKNYAIGSNPEITLEANPDDINSQKLKELKDCGINRLSIGVQSFFDLYLIQYMNILL